MAPSRTRSSIRSWLSWMRSGRSISATIISRLLFQHWNHLLRRWANPWLINLYLARQMAVAVNGKIACLNQCLSRSATKKKKLRYRSIWLKIGAVISAKDVWVIFFVSIREAFTLLENEVKNRRPVFLLAFSVTLTQSESKIIQISMN